MRLLGSLSFLMAVLMAVVILAWFSTKLFVENEARTVAQDIISDARKNADSKEPHALAIELARIVHSLYLRSNSSVTPPLLWRLRPYLTNMLLPSYARYQDGAIDVLYVQGICDSAARTLAYLLNEAELKAQQLNIVNNWVGGHSVVLVELPNQQSSMLDPLYGVYPEYDGIMLSPSEARELARRGEPSESIWKQMSENAQIGFYQRFGDAVFAPQGAGLVIEVEVSLTKRETIRLGKKNGRYEDVISDGIAHGLSSYWAYLGHRYDRSWQRVINFSQDTRMIIGLIDAPDERFVTTQMRPTFSGNELIYEVPAGMSLRFVDADAGRDWLRLRSYQEIDYIRFEPLHVSIN